MLIDNAGVACTIQPSCSGCGNAGDVVHSELRDCIFGSEGVWGFRRCADAACGLMWLDPMPLPAETSKFYDRYYTHAAQNEPGVNIQTQRRGWKPIARKLLSIALFWRPHVYQSDLAYLEGMPAGRLLEVGCGNGSFLRAAVDGGWAAFGIDFDAQAIAAAQRIPGVHAAVGDLLSMGFNDAEFDAIVMNNVIEHLPVPRRVFDECQRVLRPGGRLVMITPNAGSLGYGTYQQDWRGLEVPRHLHIFSPANLAAFARAAHFRRIATFSSAGAGTGIECLVFSQVLRARRLGRPEVTDSGRARRLLTRETWAILLGRDVGEWAVLVAHK